MKPYETAILFSPITCFYWLNPHDRWLKPSVLLQKTSYFVKWSKRSQRSATAHSQWAGGTWGQFCWDVFGHTSQLDHEVHQFWSLNSGNINAHKTCTRLGRDGDIWCDIQQTWYEYLTKCCHLTMIIHEIWGHVLLLIMSEEIHGNTTCIWRSWTQNAQRFSLYLFVQWSCMVERSADPLDPTGQFVLTSRGL